jgi:hypothetical protein
LVSEAEAHIAAARAVCAALAAPGRSQPGLPPTRWHEPPLRRRPDPAFRRAIPANPLIRNRISRSRHRNFAVRALTPPRPPPTYRPALALASAEC